MLNIAKMENLIKLKEWSKVYFSNLFDKNKAAPSIKKERPFSFITVHCF